jgi:ribonuclease P/MRP protein subunit POP5
MVVKKKIKPLMPSLRERKRYLAFEIVSERPIENFRAVNDAIWSKSLEFIGELGCSEAGIIVMHEKYNIEKQRGVVRVNNKNLNKLRATLALIEQIEDTNVIVRSLGASGVLKKVDEKFIAG